MSHRDFALPEIPAGTEPITFSMGGGRTYTCVYPLPVLMAVKIMTAQIRKVDLGDMIRLMLVPNDEEPFSAALADKHRPVPLELVEDVFWWIVEQYAERMGMPMVARLDDLEEEPEPATAEPAEQAVVTNGARRPKGAGRSSTAAG